MPQLDASWLPGKRNDLDSTKSDSVRPWLLDHDLLDLVFGHVEVFHPIQLFDQLGVLVFSQCRHQLILDIAGRGPCERAPAVTAGIDTDESRGREVQAVADAAT